MRVLFLAFMNTFFMLISPFIKLQCKYDFFIAKKINQTGFLQSGFSDDIKDYSSISVFFLLDTTVAHTAAMRPNPHIISMIDFFVFQSSI